MHADWKSFNKGKTLGKRGSENGIIIDDIEHEHGARISLEKEAPHAPYAITFGIYGLLFHTHFRTNLEAAIADVAQLQSIINKVFDMYHLPEEERTPDWYTEHDRLVHDLTID